MLAPLARLGYLAKAVVYGIVGVLATLAAAGRGGRITDTHGALVAIFAQPFGQGLLAALAVGLCGYALWRLSDAILDPDRNGTSASGLTTRVGNAVRGCVYGLLGVEAVHLLRGSRSSSGNELELWMTRVFAAPLGEWLVGLAGLAVVTHAIIEIVRVVLGTHDAKLDWSPIPPRLRRPLHRVCRLGVTTRGALLAVFGLFLVLAALSQDPNQAAGGSEALVRLAGVAGGRWGLAIIAVGVIAYAIDQAVHAWCRRIRPVV